MKRILTTALMIGVVSTCGPIGCGEKAEHTVTEKATTPEGTTETKTETTVKKTGENPPPSATEEPAKAP